MCWPNSTAWETFNRSIDGCLVLPKPSAAVCNSYAYNLNACEQAISHWSNSTWRSDQVGAMHHPYWENSSCSLFSPSTACNQGSVPVFAVNATLPEHVQATIRFAAKHNLRLVIKTSGHAYLGRSTAAGSLLLWLHYMKSMTIIEQYTSCSNLNVSNVARVGAGVQRGELYKWLNDLNLTAIGAITGTVGVAGGYLQGGGHSPLSRWKGIAADQVLEYDIVTADGRRQTVNTCQNSDLFWALRGGGGGTYAVVLSAVLRTFQSPSIVANLLLVTAPNENRYGQLIEDFIRFLPTLADDGWAGYFNMIDLNISITFHLPNGNLTKANMTFNQFAANNTDLHFEENLVFELPSFYHYFRFRTSLSTGSGYNVLLSSQIVSERAIRNMPEQVAKVLVQVKGQSKNRSILAGHFVAGGQVSNVSNANNSIDPAWRTVLLSVVYFQTCFETTSKIYQEKLVAHVTRQGEILERLSFGSSPASYLNEANPNEPNWQEKFFGSKTIYN